MGWAVLPLALSGWPPPIRAQAAGPAQTITVTLSPSSVVANGMSSSTATATLRWGPAPLPGQAVVFSSSDPGIAFGPTIDHLNGTYTTTVTSSTAAGSATITATSRWAGHAASGRATLTQAPGPANAMTLSLAPRSIIADGRSYATAVATVADARGNPIATDRVGFASSDPREEVVAVANNGNGRYTALIRSSRTVGQVAITAADTSANLSVVSELNQTSTGSLLPLVTMQWTFHYTDAYTKVLSLVVNGAPAGSTVLIGCHGTGCPFTRHLSVLSDTRRCATKGKRRCTNDGAVDLARELHNRALPLGTRLTVAITRPQWIGKYYTFDIRPGRAPRVEVDCLSPGETSPGAAC